MFCMERPLNSTQAALKGGRGVIVESKVEHVHSNKMAPELPTELWIIILRLATEVIAELNTNAVSFFEIPSPREVREDHDDVLPTRRALVHVSRAFNTIAIPFLYQSVNLTKGHAIELLVRTVDSSSNLGNLVRRMDLNISGGQWGDLQPADLSYLMNQLPNLQILVAVGSWRDDYIDVFLQSLPYFKNLRILGPLSGEIYPRSWDHVETASSLPQLRALCSPLGIQTSNLSKYLSILVKTYLTFQRSKLVSKFTGFDLFW